MSVQLCVLRYFNSPLTSMTLKCQKPSYCLPLLGKNPGGCRSMYMANPESIPLSLMRRTSAPRSSLNIAEQL